MKRLLAVGAVLGVVAMLILLSSRAEAQWVKPTPTAGGGASGGVSTGDVYAILADAGVPHPATDDFYANTFVAANRAVDGGAGTYSFISTNDSCIKYGVGTQAEFCASGNTTTFSVSSLVLPTVNIGQPACQSAQNCRWYSDGWAPGVIPRGSLPTCSAGVEGGMVFLSTDHRPYYCDGTASQRVAMGVGPASAALDFPDLGPSESSSALTLTLTGATTGDRVGCNATSDLGDDLFIGQAWVSATNTVSIRLRNGDTANNANAPSTTFTCSVLR